MTYKNIEIVSYNSDWPLEFERVAEQIKIALGDNAIAVHHIGSTSIPGLSGKPKIDVITVVRSFNNLIKALEYIGYQYRMEHEIPFRLYFTKKIGPRVNLHVFEKNNPEIELNLLFRDFLLRSEESRIEYAILKRNLLEKRSSHEKNNSRYTGYNLGKNDFIKKIIKKTGFSGLYLRPCQHYYEWQEFHRITKEQIFDPANIVYEMDHINISEANHFHYVLYKGVDIVSVAHLEFIDIQEAIIRSLATDEPYKMQGFAEHMMHLLEKWVKTQKIKIIKLHANIAVERFYRKLEYDNVEFDDISIFKKTVKLGKLL